MHLPFTGYAYIPQGTAPYSQGQFSIHRPSIVSVLPQAPPCTLAQVQGPNLLSFAPMGVSRFIGSGNYVSPVHVNILKILGLAHHHIDTI